MNNVENIKRIDKFGHSSAVDDTIHRPRAIVNNSDAIDDISMVFYI